MSRSLLDELIQIRQPYKINGLDVNKWSRIHPRSLRGEGCIVDLGCLGWNRDFDDPLSDNWAGYFFSRKRVIGVDPQECSNGESELFRGFISDFNGRGNLVSRGIGASLEPNENGEYEVLTFQKFRDAFNINEIAILKINIEGSEWGLIESFSRSDLEGVDQICVSFHDFLTLSIPTANPFKKIFRRVVSSSYAMRLGFLQPCSDRTRGCIKKLEGFGYTSLDLGIYGWRIFLRNNS